MPLKELPLGPLLGPERLPDLQPFEGVVGLTVVVPEAAAHPDSVRSSMYNSMAWRAGQFQTLVCEAIGDDA